MSGGDAGDRLERGRALARRHLGEDVVERWRAVSPDMEELTSAFAFADLWSRPGLGRRDRSIVAMAITATLRAEPQLAWHVRGALGAGVTSDEVREVLIAVAGLAGFPAAWTALEVAQPILAEHETGAAGAEHEAGEAGAGHEAGAAGAEHETGEAGAEHETGEAGGDTAREAGR